MLLCYLDDRSWLSTKTQSNYECEIRIAYKLFGQIIVFKYSISNDEKELYSQSLRTNRNVDFDKIKITEAKITFEGEYICGDYN